VAAFLLFLFGQTQPGAVGIGVGLGLQKTVANFAAGFTLLADKSIKPGDALEIDGTFGWVTEMQSRYVSIRTRDGTEMLIPNERFIAEGVINWSKSDRAVRIHAPFGVSYGTHDIEEVQALAIAAAASVKRVLPSHTPVCNLVAYGASSVDFDLRFWIADPEAGLSNVRSDVFVAIWKSFHANGIEFPFPQLDVHLKEMPRALPPAGSSPPGE
jgi:small-conductance mechanosensitive channel